MFTTFFTAGACVAVIYAVLALVVGIRQYAEWSAVLPDSPFDPTRRALDQGFGKALLRNIFILVTAILWLVFGSGWFFGSEPEVTKSEPQHIDDGPAPKPRETRLALPARCSVHLYERSEDEWDPAREEYWPPNHAWEECMGIGRRG